MIYLLDTNACIRFINGRSQSIVQRITIEPKVNIAISSITKAEMFYGSGKSQNLLASRTKQMNFFALFRSLYFDDDCAIIYGDLRAELELKGQTISFHDLMIAAVAIKHDLILVSHNTREFGRINQLKLEDWEI